MNRFITSLCALPLVLFAVTSHASNPDCQALDQEAQSSAAFYRPPLAKKVTTSGRTFLYTAPHAKCQGKQFIIEHDSVAVYQSHNNYDYAMYTNHKTGDVVFGWIKENRLTTTGTLAPE